MRRTGQRFAARQASRRTQSPIGWIRPDSSAIGMKTPGETTPCFGCVPAEQRLDTAERAGRRGVDGLIDHLELIAGRQRLAKLRLDPRGDAGRRSPSHRRRCGSGCAPRTWRDRARCRPCASARRGRRRNRAPIATPIETPTKAALPRSSKGCDTAWMMRSQRATTSSGDVTSDCRTANSSPPEPRHAILVAREAGQPIGQFADQVVSGRMAERVVDVLESVEVEIEERNARAVAPRARSGCGRVGR